MITVPISSDDEQRRVRRQRARAGGDALLGRERAGDREHRDDQPVAREQHRDAERRVVERRVGGQPGERAAVVVAGRGERVQDLREKPCAAGIGDAGLARRRPCTRDAPCRPARRNGGIRIAIDAIFISKASIFLPRYSGVRPTISPAMNTAMIANISMPYRPEPTPPKITSPSWISHIGTSPPSGVNESCIALTEPFDAAVVAVAQSAELAMPKRTSLPSMLPPGLRRGRDLVDAELRQARVARAAPATTQTPSSATNMIVIAASMRPALARVADHLAERVAERRRDQQDREHFEEIRRAASDSRTDAPS